MELTFSCVIFAKQKTKNFSLTISFSFFSCLFLQLSILRDDGDMNLAGGKLGESFIKFLLSKNEEKVTLAWELKY